MPMILEANLTEVTTPRRTGCIAGRKVCANPVVGTWTGMCEHEHFRSGPICELHLGRALAGKCCCRECLDHPERPHDLCHLGSILGLCR